MFRNSRKIVFCCCFWIPLAIFIGSLRQRQMEQSQKSHAAQGQNTVHSHLLQMLQAGLQFGTDLAYLGGRRIKTKPHASRKMKKAGCGGEAGNSSFLILVPRNNMHKNFSQRSNKPHWKKKVLCQLSSKTISAHSLELLASTILLISPLTFCLTVLTKRIISIDRDRAYGSAFWQASPLLPAIGKHEWSNIWIFYLWLQPQRWKRLVKACLRLPPHGESREWGEVTVYLQFPWHCDVPTAYTEKNLFSNPTQGEKTKTLLALLSINSFFPEPPYVNTLFHFLHGEILLE